jgi:hypothetical protein
MRLHKGTNIIDLQGKVKISTEDGKTLETEQLYFDQKKRMVLQKENLNYQIQRELPWARNRF